MSCVFPAHPHVKCCFEEKKVSCYREDSCNYQLVWFVSVLGHAFVDWFVPFTLSYRVAQIKRIRASVMRSLLSVSLIIQGWPKFKHGDMALLITPWISLAKIICNMSALQDLRYHTTPHHTDPHHFQESSFWEWSQGPYVVFASKRF